LFFRSAGAWTHLRTARRPLARRASGLGIWLHVLHFTALMAIATNALILGLASAQLDSWLPGLSGTEKLLAVLVYEHVLLLLRWAVRAAVPTVPVWIAKELEREQGELKRARAKVIGDGDGDGEGGAEGGDWRRGGAATASPAAATTMVTKHAPNMVMMARLGKASVMAAEKGPLLRNAATVG